MTAPVTPLQFSYAPRTGVPLLLLPVPGILFHLLGAFALAFLSIKTLFPTEIYLADSSPCRSLLKRYLLNEGDPNHPF